MNKIIAKLNSLTGGLYETSKWELTAIVSASKKRASLPDLPPELVNIQ